MLALVLGRAIAAVVVVVVEGAVLGLMGGFAVVAEGGLGFEVGEPADGVVHGCRTGGGGNWEGD